LTAAWPTLGSTPLHLIRKPAENALHFKGVQVREGTREQGFSGAHVQGIQHPDIDDPGIGADAKNAGHRGAVPIEISVGRDRPRGDLVRVALLLHRVGLQDLASQGQVDIPAGSPNFLTVSREVPEVGERVVVIGSPQLLELTVSEGIVSAIRTETHKGQAIQMTAPISGGSSSGPVINLRGEVVGVSTFYREGGQNLNFAISGNRIPALTPGPAKALTEYYTPGS
jgi:hypothetical protein